MFHFNRLIISDLPGLEVGILMRLFWYPYCLATFSLDPSNIFGAFELGFQVRGS